MSTTCTTGLMGLGEFLDAYRRTFSRIELAGLVRVGANGWRC
jgi:hypothetical protein